MIRIVADTTCCVTGDRMQALGIDFVPQIITFEGVSYRDDFELSTEAFLEKLRAAKKPSRHRSPTTRPL